jgi:ubiquinone/menaquinone biosynthesis C-methylase UbiE
MTGLDADPNILALARKKARNTGVDIAFDEGRSDDMPYATGEFEVAFSSLFFHHLQTPEKLRSMAEVLRVLRPGGVFHVCDWGRPSNLFSRVMFNAVRLLDGFDVTQDNVDGRLSFFLEEAGFSDIKMLGHVETMLGTLDLMVARSPNH